MKFYYHFAKNTSKEYFRHPLGKLTFVALITLALLISNLISSGNFNKQLNAQIASDNSPFTQKIIECLDKPVTERQACAELIGQEVKATISNPIEQYKECMKLRPLYNRYCQESLTP